MGRMKDKRNVVHYGFWAAYFRGLGGTFTGTAAIQSETELFGASNPPANLAAGNKLDGGIFADFNFFKILSIRVQLFFYRMSSNAVSTMTGAVDDLTCMMLAQSNMVYTLKMSQKEMIQGNPTFFPAGGGPGGDLGTLTTPMLSNGEATARAVAPLAAPIIISPQQLATIKCNHVPTGVGDLVADLNGSSAGIASNIVTMDGIFVRATL